MSVGNKDSMAGRLGGLVQGLKNKARANPRFMAALTDFRQARRDYAQGRAAADCPVHFPGTPREDTPPQKS